MGPHPFPAARLSPMHFGRDPHADFGLVAALPKVVIHRNDAKRAAALQVAEDASEDTRR